MVRAIDLHVSLTVRICFRGRGLGRRFISCPHPSERGSLLGAVDAEVEQLSSRYTKPRRAAGRDEAVFPWFKRLAHRHFENSRSNLLNVNRHRVLRARTGLPAKSRSLPHKQLALFFVALHSC